jgi:hypothetical protein
LIGNLLDYKNKSPEMRENSERGRLDEEELCMSEGPEEEDKGNHLEREVAIY